MRRLEAALQSEIDRKDKAADMELVESCEELLWQIGTQGKLVFEDRSKENQAALMQRLERKRRRTAAQRLGMRATAAITAILMLIVVGDGILNREWLSGHSADDGQQYAIQGQSIDPGLVEAGVAASDDSIADSLTTTDWGAVIAFLGMEPMRPDYLPDGWRVGQYHAARFDDKLILNIIYINEADPTATMIFLWDHYFSVEAANLALEQNGDGELVEIGGILVNGQMVTIVSDAGSYSVEHGFFSNFSAALTCISNVGPAFEAVGPYSSFAGYNGFSSIMLTLTMMLGRLAILPVLILFSRRAWQKM